MRDEQVQPTFAQSTELASELRRRLQGEVRFDAGSRGAYSTDASNYRQIPIGVVVPKTVDDVVAAIDVCRQFHVPITSRGGGTSLAGQCCNVTLVIDWSKYLHHVRAVDADRRLARVDPGCVLDRLRQEADKQAGLTFGPDPATHSHCTLGGMIGNNSCGVHSVMSEFYGAGPRTEDNVESLDILTYDGLRLTVGPTDEQTLEQRIQEGGRRGDIYRQLRSLRDRYADQIRSRYPHVPRRVSGYNLPALLPENGFNLAAALVGSEGTCVTVLGATVKLLEKPKARALLVLGYPDVYAAADHVPQIRTHQPIGMEGIDDLLVQYMKRKGVHPKDLQLLPEGSGWLLVEFGGNTRNEAKQKAQELIDELRQGEHPPSLKLFDDSWEENRVWEIRESGLAATAHVPSMAEAYPGWEDAAVAPDRLGSYLRGFRQLLNEFDYQCSLYGHFGQGCVHCRITFDLKTHSGVDKYRRFIDRATELVIEHDGVMSGEHGDGQSRAALLPKLYGDDLVEAFRQFKSIWDPLGKMNPGKIVDPYPPESNLRWSPQNYHPRTVTTEFRYPQDGGSFVGAVNRCVGIGKCRRDDHGTMCPSYMVTREEVHSTRGRARLLYEMLQGDVVRDGWRSDDVHEALDLCLACKGCRSDCPVNVDMATYKAEFLSHYYAGRLRPRIAYAMGWIYWWARFASHFPRTVNFLSQTWPFSSMIKRAIGMASSRRIPEFSERTFVHWFRHRSPVNVSDQPRRRAVESSSIRHEHVPRYQSTTFVHGDDEYGRSLNAHSKLPVSGSRRVMLWPDTFTNYLKPEAARAAVLVLEDAGFQVIIPPKPLCCGRPLYDWGMLDTAKRLWLETLHALQSEIDAETPLVGLEPSCVAAFRDELVNFFPGDGRAKRLSENTLLLSEFLERQQYQPPPLKRKAIVHGHCHHKAVMHMDAEVAQLQKLGLDFEILDSGCCGMAGAFGFDKRHFDVSIAAGERVLLPRIRAAAPDTLIIANGFSCQTQIEQCTGRKALHIAEVIYMAIRHATNDRASTIRQAKPAVLQSDNIRQ